MILNLTNFAKNSLNIFDWTKLHWYLLPLQMDHPGVILVVDDLAGPSNLQGIFMDFVI